MVVVNRVVVCKDTTLSLATITGKLMTEDKEGGIRYGKQYKASPDYRTSKRSQMVVIRLHRYPWKDR